MSTPTTPHGTTPDMKRIEETSKAAIPPEFASAVNLLAHPMAGAAAAGALGIGLASQAVGMWMGAVAGAAEVSQRLLSTTLEAEPRKPEARKGAKLALVPAPEAAAAAARTVLADAEAVVRDVTEVASEAAEAALADAAAAVAPPVTARKKAVEPEAPAAARKPAGIERPSRPDDLKAISGVGPKLEKVLNDLGLWTHAQIAALSPAEIVWLDDHLGFAGRIGRDNWLGQARLLASTAKSGK